MPKIIWKNQSHKSINWKYHRQEKQIQPIMRTNSVSSESSFEENDLPITHISTNLSSFKQPTGHILTFHPCPPEEFRSTHDQSENQDIIGSYVNRKEFEGGIIKNDKLKSFTLDMKEAIQSRVNLECYDLFDNICISLKLRRDKKEALRHYLRKHTEEKPYVLIGDFNEIFDIDVKPREKVKMWISEEFIRVYDYLIIDEAEKIINYTNLDLVLILCQFEIEQREFECATKDLYYPQYMHFR